MKLLLRSSTKYDLGCLTVYPGSRIPVFSIPDPDPGVKKAMDPGSGTLKFAHSSKPLPSHAIFPPPIPGLSGVANFIQKGR
jgi:hypothetical protein